MTVVEHHSAEVYGLLHELGYEWLVPRSKHRKSDPDAIAALKKSPGITCSDSV